MNQRLIEKADELISKEKGTIFKDPGGRINICLVYPNIYSVGMSNLGFQGIYGLLNKRDDVVCERAFLPDEDDIEEYIRTKTPIFSLESKRPLSRFDIIAFSISFENDYPDILKILSLAQIPFYTYERNEFHPILIAGGACCFFNPEVIAPFFDIIFIGEAEESLNEFLNVYRGEDKRQLKERVIGIEGIYIPEFYDIKYSADGRISERSSKQGAPEKIKRRYLKDLSLVPIATSIITPEAEFSDMYLIEVMRGCPWNCRFCIVSQIYKPLRKKNLGFIKEDIKRAKINFKEKNSNIRIGLIGPSLTDYPHIIDILCNDGVDFSITSLRASKESAKLVGFMKGHKSVSIAPEAGTERMRRVINKRVTEENILETSELILNSGIENLKLYFMIGLPTEDINDIMGIIELTKKIRSLSDKGKIILSISTFVPKPFTPFQWHEMERLDIIKGKLRFIKKELMHLRNVKVFHDVPKYAHMQGLFSLGNRMVSNVLVKILEREDYKKACLDAKIDPDFFIFRRKDFNEILPWDFIDMGISKEQLWNEYMIALSQV